MNKYRLWTKTYHKDLDGNALDLTFGQQQMFDLIYNPSYKRVAIKTVTQYGKSLVSALATIHIMVDAVEKILIVSPSQKQSNIIMGYVIDHFFDHEHLQALLEVNEPLERLKRERSKQRITIKTGSEVATLTANARTLSQQAKGLMGFGATIVIVDESALIPDDMYAKILRMVGGTDGKLVQLGNPFPSEHFKRAFELPQYETLTIDYKQAVAEGRLSQEFVEEARATIPEYDFTVFYDVEFPQGGGEDSVIPQQAIEKALRNEMTGAGDRQAGLDVARFGKDKTVLVVREGGKVVDIHETEKTDTMGVVGWVQGYIDKTMLVNVDIVGIGSGVYDRLYELGFNVQGINVGESPTTDEAKRQFVNLRAEMFWDLRKWFMSEDICIPNDTDLGQELAEIRYGYSSERKIKIESKELMKKRIGRSPDKADALALAFFQYEENTADLIIM